MYSVNLGKTVVQWSENEVYQKLKGIQKLESKSNGWIQSNLDVSASGTISRFFWSLLGNCCFCLGLREWLYGVDLAQSKEILKQLAPQIQGDNRLTPLFASAVKNFNTLVPNHQFHLKETKPTEKEIPKEQPKSTKHKNSSDEQSTKKDDKKETKTIEQSKQPENKETRKFVNNVLGIVNRAVQKNIVKELQKTEQDDKAEPKQIGTPVKPEPVSQQSTSDKTTIDSDKFVDMGVNAITRAIQHSVFEDTQKITNEAKSEHEQIQEVKPAVISQQSTSNEQPLNNKTLTIDSKKFVNQISNVIQRAVQRQVIRELQKQDVESEQIQEVKPAVISQQSTSDKTTLDPKKFVDMGVNAITRAIQHSAFEDTQKIHNDDVKSQPKIQEVKAEEIRLQSASQLIAMYDQCWDEANKCFKDIPFNQSAFRSFLEAHNEKFSVLFDPEKYYGIIGKKDVEADTKVIVRADLHAALKDLLELLKELQRQGLLGKDGKCKPGVQIILLGDYGDRGPHSVEVLQLIMTLRMENPDQVTLIRGNHESLWANRSYCGNDSHFKGFLFDKDFSVKNTSLLLKAYQSMFLTMYMGEINKDGGRQYIQFTHAAFEYYIDPTDMLKSEKTTEIMLVPKQREFSKRVQEIKIDEDYLKKYEKEAPQRTERKQWKLMKAAKVIQDLQKKEGRRLEDFTAYNWGDIDNDGYSYPGDLGNRYWSVGAQDVKNYLNLCSTLEDVNPVKVKKLIRGHQHKKRHHKVKDKVLVTTLTVGMDSTYAPRYPDQKDTFYVIEMKPKISNCTKTVFERVAGESKTTKGKTLPLQGVEDEKDLKIERQINSLLDII